MYVMFATQSYRLPSLPISAQSVVNMYAEREPKDAKTPVAVLGHPGIRTFATCGSGPIRGMRNFGGTLYVVSGGTLYSVSSTGVVTSLGGTITGTSLVSMSDNGALPSGGGQLCIVNSANGYIYSTTGGFQLITDPNFFPADVVTFFDSYFVFNKRGTNQFFLSNLLDGTTYQATNIASADGQAGNLVSIVNQQNNLLLFGQTHMETWWDSGAANFPFSRYTGATVERGCVGGLSTVKDDNSVFFLGDDSMHYRLDGTIPHRVSTHGIEAVIKSLNQPSSVVSHSYTWNGHKFIVLTFPSAPWTAVYDVSSGLWHERNSWDANGNALNRWRVNAHEVCYGQDFFGDSQSGQVGVLDPTIQTEFGAVMQSQITSMPIHEDRRRIFHDFLELDMETGVGTSTGQGNMPQAMMDFSDDGGRTWSVQRWASIGAQGDFRHRVYWDRLGQSRQRVYRITISDPVPRNIISAELHMRKGAY